MRFSRRMLEGYLAVAIVILTVVAFVVLSGAGFGRTDFIVAAILVIILISVNILHAVLQLRIIDQLQAVRAEMHKNGESGEDAASAEDL